MSRRLAVLLVMLLVMLSTPAGAGEQSPLNFGVLLFRPKAQTLAQWQPLADYLSSVLGRPVTLSVHDYREMNAAVEQNQVDIVLTNAGHFILLRQRYSLSPPLATVINLSDGHALTSYGGTIFARADNQAINTLADLAGKRVGATSKDSLAGYQLQAFELLEAGVPLPDGKRLLITENPHDRVVEAVLSGQADAGFVRTGVLESLAAEGKLEPSRVKVINRQKLPSFPYATSTRLCPEWPLAVAPHVDAQLARRLASALLLLPPDSASARAAGIHGFNVPADYRGVEDMLHSLRLPPFDRSPEFTLLDLWHRYAVWLLALGGLLALLAGMALWLGRQNRLLQQSNYRFSALFESSPEPMWLLANGRFVDCNQVAVELLGRADKGAVLQRGPADFSPALQPDGQESRRRAEVILAAVAVGLQQRFEWVFLREDGCLVTLAICLTPIPLRGQTMVLAVGHDITQRKRDERALMESEERFRTVADFTLGWEYWQGPAQEILYMSPSSAAVTGYPRERFVTTPGLLTEVVHSEDRERYLRHRQDIGLHEDGLVEFRIVREDGQIRWLEHVCHPVWDSTGEYRGRRVSNRDITERRQAEEEKAALEAKFQQLQKAESLGRMAGAIAHHFNNLLTVVIGYLELVQEEAPGEAPFRRNLDQAMRAAQRATEVGGLMLTYLGQIPARNELLDLGDTCRQCLPILRAAMPLSVTMEIDFPSPGPMVESNSHQIQQILTNLATNAWEAMGEGGGVLRMAIGTEDPAEIPVHYRHPLDWQPTEAGYAYLEVKDNGCGITEGDISRIFDPFFTTKFTGRGLGLAVVLGIVRAHRGAVTVRSEVGRGSTLRVFLPMAG